MIVFKYHDFDKAYKEKPNIYLSDEAGVWPRLMGKYLRILWLYIYWEKYSFTIRLFGYGLKGKSLKYTTLFFSERNGYKKYYKLFGWKFEFLK